MKVEIESEELFKMRDDVKSAQKEIRELKEQLKQLNVENLKGIVRRNSYTLAERYLQAIFKKLGFEQTGKALDFECGFTQFSGDDWYLHPEKVEVTINAIITEKFRQAYLSLGVAEVKKSEKNTIDLLNEI